ncbi:MAG: zinc ribbon domain-containing protein [Planctomycetota bacterium]|jgi:putative FmdB family regulatory protein|nr:FmdB family transcriptional regulator [Planctomycetota bacterium]MDP6370388.1 zinc ribbon domain-containing protein [Planctomycetota bacterium]MDP6519110.1 zinc ribbon domain-containing protein [Planctomycetota bacterium]MDP6839547.1 zinc ribbon domain-containing protein [Planctomycetota bacterium]MDP6956469.1 zinc ribbon domain-containing protein [Planctomycetota bacterium]
MPIFEYTCASCDREFEELIMAGEAPTCPGCGARDGTKRLSAFAVSNNPAGSPPDPAADPCAGCGTPDGPPSCPFG